MLRRLPRRLFRLAAIVVLALGLFPALAHAQVVVKVNDTVNFRLGFQLQAWADWTQDPVSEGYQQSLFIRRVRLIMAGNIAKNVSFFFQTDNPNMGKTVAPATTKALNTGFLTQDAFIEWKPFSNDQFIVGIGKMLMPITRGSLQQTSSHLSWDGGTFTFLQSGPIQADAGRDLGFQVKSYLANDHLEFRGGVFDGFRAPANTGGAGSRNSLRATGRLVYNFFDTEKGYVPVGTNLGKRKILSIGGGYDTQSTYKAYGGDFMIDWPFGPGDAKTGRDAITAHADFIHFDGGCDLTSTGARATNCLLPTLIKQDELFTDFGYFCHALNLQPFVRFEWDGFVDDIDHGKNQRRYGGGFNYYVTPAAQQLKITIAYERIVPNTAPATAKTKNTNHFLVQFQIIYF